MRGDEILKIRDHSRNRSEIRQVDFAGPATPTPIGPPSRPISSRYCLTPHLNILEVIIEQTCFNIPRYHHPKKGIRAHDCARPVLWSFPSFRALSRESAIFMPSCITWIVKGTQLTPTIRSDAPTTHVSHLEWKWNSIAQSASNEWDAKFGNPKSRRRGIVDGLDTTRARIPKPVLIRQVLQRVHLRIASKRLSLADQDCCKWGYLHGFAICPVWMAQAPTFCFFHTSPYAHHTHLNCPFPLSIEPML